MEVTGEQIIAARVLRELVGAGTVALGPGMPEALIPYITNGTRWFKLGKEELPPDGVDVVVVEALEVSEVGDVAVPASTHLEGCNGRRWVVASPLAHNNGNPLIVKECRFPVGKEHCVELVVTDLGVIEVGRVGFELTEIAPGFSSDDVRRRVRASLHVADNLDLIRTV